MTRYVPIKYLITMLALSVFSFQANAYEDEKGKELCRHPKIQEFNLTEYSEPDKKEVPAEAEFGFVISSWSNPKKIKIEAKGKKIPFTVESNESYHTVKGKLPAEFNGQFVRLSVRIPAVLGCYSTQGWLLKVADKPVATEAPSAPAETPEAAPAEAKPAEAPADSGATTSKLEQQAPVTPAESGLQVVPAPQTLLVPADAAPKTEAPAE